MTFSAHLVLLCPFFPQLLHVTCFLFVMATFFPILPLVSFTLSWSSFRNKADDKGKCSNMHMLKKLRGVLGTTGGPRPDQAGALLERRLKPAQDYHLLSHTVLPMLLYVRQQSSNTRKTDSLHEFGTSNIGGPAAAAALRYEDSKWTRPRLLVCMARAARFGV